MLQVQSDWTALFMTQAMTSLSTIHSYSHTPPPTPSTLHPHRLKARIKFRQTGLLVRGAGRNITTIYMPLPLADLYGGDRAVGPSTMMSRYAHSDGFIWFQGYDPIIPNNKIADVVAPAVRGDQRLFVSKTVGFAVGQWVRLVEDGDTGGLITDMTGGEKGPSRRGCSWEAAPGKVAVVFFADHPQAHFTLKSACFMLCPQHTNALLTPAP